MKILVQKYMLMELEFILEWKIKGKNISECVIGLKQTNQRAEIMAVIRAIESVSNYENILINTDSKYTVNALTVWYKKWENNNWKRIDGKSVKNIDLLKKALKLIKERNGYTKLKHVVGHKGIHGNEQANYLANMSIFLLKKK
ncbi:unnamed protein product [Pneumocystis jirovecii]|uniref:ribonuclease H n=1 Tax=Pneumocystis jirovecii TaxID=42068 RepID=L0PBQ5_PNEJI|nr:unnamed protein product [Pneumocystis jirovecii]